MSGAAPASVGAVAHISGGGIGGLGGLGGGAALKTVALPHTDHCGTSWYVCALPVMAAVAPPHTFSAAGHRQVAP